MLKAGYIFTCVRTENNRANRIQFGQQLLGQT